MPETPSLSLLTYEQSDRAIELLLSTLVYYHDMLSQLIKCPYFLCIYAWPKQTIFSECHGFYVISFLG